MKTVKETQQQKQKHNDDVVLDLLFDNSPYDLTSLVEETELTRQTVVASLTRLEKQGLIRGFVNYYTGRKLFRCSTQYKRTTTISMT